MSKVLQASGLFGGYGGTDILNGVELAANAGELAVVVGPNGAGKSTALKALFKSATCSRLCRCGRTWRWAATR